MVFSTSRTMLRQAGRTRFSFTSGVEPPTCSRIHGALAVSMRQATVTSTLMSLPSWVLNSMSSRSARSPSVFDCTMLRFCSATLKTCQSVMIAGKV